MSSKPRALIVGGSVGGLFAANLLRKIGWDVAVYERAAGDLASRGAAIGVTHELFDVLAQLGIALDVSDVGHVHSYIALDRDGSIAHEVQRKSVTAAWANIYRPLRDILPNDCYRAGIALDHVEQTAARVTAIFSDGTRADGDLLIGADGINSAVRHQFAPQAQPRYAGYVAWRGTVSERDIAAADRELMFNHLVFCLPKGEMLLSIPIPAEQASGGGERRCVYIWYRSADEHSELPALNTDAQGKRHGSIPPPLIRPEVIRELKASAAALFPPVIANIIARVDQPLLQAISDLESPQLAFGRVALLGDAAFIARPHAVAGVTKAALDAQSIADPLAAGGTIEDALNRYDHDRRDFAGKLVAHARYLGGYLQAGPEPTGEVLMLHEHPDIVLRDYGAPHLLRKPGEAAR